MRATFSPEWTKVCIAHSRIQRDRYHAGIVQTHNQLNYLRLGCGRLSGPILISGGLGSPPGHLVPILPDHGGHGSLQWSDPCKE
jgi:hypothetical protein